MKIEFKTNNEIAFNHFKPIPSKKLMPDWYKNMPTSIKGIDKMNAKKFAESNSQTHFTIKGCVPVLDYITSGYILTSHTDILITPEFIQEKDTKTFWWKSNGMKVESHGNEQCPIKINNVNNEYWKFMSAWAIKLPKGYSCYFYQPEYFMETRYKLFPAIVDCDGYNFQPVNFPGVILSNESFIIKAGDPIMAVFPFKRDDWKSEINLLSNEETNKPNVFFTYLERAYKNLFHSKKSYD